jgi:acrylyl-CoA reductase (NADPH)
MCSTMKVNGVIASIGLAASPSLNTTVMPFILRGVSLLGIDSVMCPQKPRQAAWDRLGRDLEPALLNTIATEIGLADTIQGARDLIDGKIRGRLIVDVNR